MFLFAAPAPATTVLCKCYGQTQFHILICIRLIETKFVYLFHSIWVNIYWSNSIYASNSNICQVVLCTKIHNNVCWLKIKTKFSGNVWNVTQSTSFEYSPKQNKTRLCQLDFFFFFSSSHHSFFLTVINDSKYMRRKYHSNRSICFYFTGNS